MKVLTIQDISCYGQCSTTVALPILSHYGLETAILPSAILSTHTAGFKDFTVLDLTDEMPKIIDHWYHEGIKFDCIYTGYIGDKRQFDYILKCKDLLLNPKGLFIVDPAMADNGKLYPALNTEIIFGMRKLCMQADYIIPNITEGAFLTGNDFKEIQDSEYINKLLKDLFDLGCKNVILTGVQEDSDTIGAVAYDGITRTYNIEVKEDKSYHGTGDIFSSIIVADIMNNKSIKDTLKHACRFVIDAIRKTSSDDTHSYGVKYEEVLRDEIKD